MDLTIYHFVLIAAFVAIVVWVFGHKRKARFVASIFKEEKVAFTL